LSLDSVGQEYEEAYRHAFSEIDSFEVKVDTPQAKKTFEDCMDQMLADGQVNWGRVIGR